MVAISVVMSVYNEPVDWIRQSIDSILNQTFRYFEFIIINDNPEGISQKKLLKDFAAKDNRIKIIENEENKGLTKSLNIGISKATGKYIARMDADDISMPNRFQVQFDYMESHPEIDICGTWAKLFGDIPLIAYKANKLPIEPDQIKLFALFYNPMIHPTIMIRRRSFTLPIYNKDFKKAQDYVLIGESLISGKKLANIPKILLKYRATKKSGEEAYVSQQSISSNYIRKKMLQREFTKITEDQIQLNNNIVTYQPYELELAEQWLIHVKALLSDTHGYLNEFLNGIFQIIWANVCLSNNCSYSFFRNSTLYDKFSFLYFMRFIKRRIM